MNASDFVRKLSAIAPSIESLCGLGLSVTEAESIRSHFRCVPRKSPVPLIVSNELLDLISRWDVSTVEIGMVWMRDLPSRYHNRGTQIATYEVDPIIILDDTSEMIAEEDRHPGHLLWNVAQSPAHFLDALIVAAKFLGDVAIGSVEFDDLEAAKAIANNCAALSGGEQYSEFYYMMLGAYKAERLRSTSF